MGSSKCNKQKTVASVLDTVQKTFRFAYIPHQKTLDHSLFDSFFNLKNHPKYLSAPVLCSDLYSEESFDKPFSPVLWTILLWQRTDERYFVCYTCYNPFPGFLHSFFKAKNEWQVLSFSQFSPSFSSVLLFVLRTNGRLQSLLSSVIYIQERRNHGATSKISKTLLTPRASRESPQSWKSARSPESHLASLGRRLGVQRVSSKSEQSVWESRQSAQKSRESA
jgi:hypothetical protein